MRRIDGEYKEGYPTVFGNCEKLSGNIERKTYFT